MTKPDFPLENDFDDSDGMCWEGGHLGDVTEMESCQATFAFYLLSKDPLIGMMMILKTYES